MMDVGLAFKGTKRLSIAPLVVTGTIAARRSTKEMNFKPTPKIADIPGILPPIVDIETTLGAIKIATTIEAINLATTTPHMT
jgi:hypothetical protein